MKRIISVKVSPISEFRSQSDLAKCKFSNLTLSSKISEVYKTKRLSQEIINVNYGINEYYSTKAENSVLPTVKKNANYKAWWENGENVNSSISNLHRDNSSFDSKQSELNYNEFEAVLINSPSMDGNNVIPFAFQILDDNLESETPEEKNGINFLGTFSDDSKHESELDDFWKNHENQNAINSSETSTNLIKRAEYVIPISNFNACHKSNENSHSERPSVGPLLINIKTYGKTSETANTYGFNNFETASKCVEFTNKNHTQILRESNSIFNQSTNNLGNMPNCNYQDSCKITVGRNLSKAKHSSTNKNISEQFNSFQQHTGRSKVKTVSIQKSSIMLTQKCEKTSDYKYRCLLTNAERKKCKDVKAACDSESEEEFFIRIPLMKRKTRSFCCHEKNCKSKNRSRFPKNECSSKKKGEKRNKNSLMVNKSSVLTSNTYSNCIILNKDKANKFEETILQKHLTDSHEAEQKAQASCSKVHSSGLLSRTLVENRHQKYNNENNRKLAPSGGSNKRSFNFHKLESNKSKKLGIGEENWKYGKGKNFECGNLVRTVNRKELRPLVDFVAVDEISKVNTKEKLAKFNLGNDMITALYGTSNDENESFENKPQSTPRYSANRNENNSFMKNASLKCAYENDQRLNPGHHNFRNNCESSMHHSGQFREEVENVTYEKYLANFSTEINNFQETLKEANNSVKHFVVNQKSNFQEDKTQPLPVTPVLIFPVKYDESFKRIQDQLLHISSSNNDTQSSNSEHVAFTKTKQNAFNIAIGNEDSVQRKEISLKDNYVIVSGNRIMPKSSLNKSLIPITELFRENMVGNSTSQLLNDENACNSAKENRAFMQNVCHQSVEKEYIIPNSNDDSSKNQIIDFRKQSIKSEDNFEDYSSFKRQGENIAINSSSGKEMAQILYGSSANTSFRNNNICHSPMMESKKTMKNSLLTESKCITDKESNAKDWRSLHQKQNHDKNKSSRTRKPCGIVPGLNIE
ncbi:putative uncharacterized protein DDB_G0282133 [Argiope bruennichi]|uniref:putative uncharacterized protein DDB_G0282133 n=1 Tax=Argiope bruennichi TaxID=94029 RepID=UPI00249458FF|nr:putative uncharacterized protein DDB_G0282133 [Argiope bruennichi]